MTTVRFAWRSGAAALAVATVASCGADAERGASTARVATVPALVLPDLTSMAPSVQRQLSERHATLTAMSASPTASPSDLPGAYGELGKLLMAAQLNDAAGASFANAERLAPSDFRWPYYRAHLARRAGDLASALPLLERTVALAPDDVAARIWLGDVTLALGRAADARPHFERALALQPSSLSARFGLGRVALALDAPREAVEHFEDVITRDATAAAVHYPLSQAYARLGDAAKAEQHLRLRREHEILPADPLLVELDAILESPQTYETLGIRALNAERWDEAAAVFRKGLALDGQSAALHFRLGTALRMQGQADAARSEFETAVGLDAEYFPALYSLGVIDQAQGRHREAITRFEAALEARGTYAEARVRLADSLRRVGRVREALTAYDTVLAADATLVDARFGRAMALVQAGRFREAAAALTAVADAHSDRPELAHALARVLAAAPDAAARDGRRALTIAEGLVAKGRTLELGETMAMALAEVGEPARAAAIQRDLVGAATRAGLAAALPRLRRNLAAYERGEACRTPWDAGEVP